MDEKLISQARERLYTGVISDVLDGLGNMHHALAPKIRPLDDRLVLSATCARRFTCRSIMSSREAIPTS